jgi:serine/threonine protein kinase
VNEEKLSAGESAAPQIENIEIVELLGKGGMSVVFKARQTQLDRLVAVKVLTCAGTEERIRRFQKEARLTGALEHANIVKTISCGVCADGRPYLIMEYLQGRSLADELKANGRLSLQKFKDVFEPALSALDFAHKKGLIHRDIKPGNIMLCMNESGLSTIKLVDFGIAKVFAEPESEAQNLTRTDALLGTPAYMSPEQCLGKQLDGRSDLYSLACVMFECLCGQPPFSGQTALEVMHKHGLEPPPSMSTFNRTIDVSKELAEVVLWGLAKDPGARPQSAREFAARLSRVLETLTLDRVPQLRKSEQAQQLWRQYWPAVALSVLCAGGMLAAALTLACKKKQEPLKPKITSARTIMPKEEGCESDAKRALESCVRAHGSNHYLVAKNLKQFAECYAFKGKWAEAEPLFRRALSIREKTFGQNNLDTVFSMADLAGCWETQGKYAEAVELYKRAIAIVRKKFSANSEFLAKSLNRLALCYEQQRIFDLAEQAHRQCLSYSREAYGAENKAVGDALIRLADCFKAQGKYDRAEPFLKQALAMREKDLGEKATITHALNRWDAYLKSAGRHAYFSKDLSDSSLSIHDKHDCMRATSTMTELADCYLQQRKLPQAEMLFLRSLELREKNGIQDDDFLSATLYQLGLCYALQNKLTQAEPLYRRSIALKEKCLSERPATQEPDQCLETMLNALGDCCFRQGKWAEAERVGRRLLLLLDQHPGKITVRRNQVLTFVERCCRSQGKSAGTGLLNVRTQSSPAKTAQ